MILWLIRSSESAMYQVLIMLVLQPMKLLYSAVFGSSYLKSRNGQNSMIDRYCRPISTTQVNLIKSLLSIAR